MNSNNAKTPFLHYLREGVKLGFNPNPFFDSKWYMDRYLEVAKSGMNPLVHFINKGADLGYDPHPLFDNKWYKAHYSYLMNSKISSLNHYLKAGFLQGMKTIETETYICKMKIAIIIHAYYEDTIDELFSWFDNIPIDFDLILTIPSEKFNLIKPLVEAKYKNAIIIQCKNSGYDIMSFLELVRNGSLLKYDVVCKLHTKKGETHPNAWRHLLLGGLLGSDDLIKKILTCFFRDPNLMVLGTANTYVDGELHSFENKKNLNEIFKKMYPNSKAPDHWGFFAGTMFWVRPQAYIELATLIETNFSFEEGFYKNDGLLAHAIERLFGLIPTFLHQRIGLTWGRNSDITPTDVEIISEPIGLVNEFNPLLEAHEKKIRSINSLSFDAVLTNESFKNKYIRNEKLTTLISVIMPVYNTDTVLLEACIESVINQTYSNWELCICDDSSNRNETIETLSKYSFDSRIKIIRSEKNLHIAGAANLAVSISSGDFLAFLDHDDLFHANALREIAIYINKNPSVDLLYTDEDKVDYDGLIHSQPFLKPDWSFEHLMSNMYMLHILVIRREHFFKVGRMRIECNGSQDYDLALRSAPTARHVGHIPLILYHWRQIPGSTAMDIDAKPYAKIAQIRSLTDAIKQTGRFAKIEEGRFEGTYRIRWSIEGNPEVTLLILTNFGKRDVPGRGTIHLLKNFITSIKDKSTYKNYNIIVIDNDNADDDMKSFLKNNDVDLIHYNFEPPFNFSSKINFAFKQVKTNHVICLNDDVEVITPDWIESLLEFSQKPEIGIVGGRLYFADLKTQHAGVVLLESGPAHIFYGLPKSEIGYAGYCSTIRNYLSVTGAVMATRMDVVNEIGGFDETFAVDYNDVDFNLRVWEKGYRIVYTPHCEMFHFEGSTLARRVANQKDADAFLKRWNKILGRDPFYSSNLPASYSLRHREPNHYYNAISYFFPGLYNTSRYISLSNQSLLKGKILFVIRLLPRSVKIFLKKWYTILRIFI
ncbi:MAG: glycosyltransferase [Leptospiraceae bacterium]|nr:glycosyltransferase [Leptospiraceae bacterium]